MFSTRHTIKVEIYPREGTETKTTHPLFITLPLKFIPVRGRKPAELAHSPRKLQLKFIPVRGRKLKPIIDNITSALLKFIPVRGRKLLGKNITNKFDSLKFIPERGRKLCSCKHLLYISDS